MSTPPRLWARQAASFEGFFFSESDRDRHRACLPGGRGPGGTGRYGLSHACKPQSRGTIRRSKNVPSVKRSGSHCQGLSHSDRPIGLIRRRSLPRIPAREAALNFGASSAAAVP
eukprot:616141-Hanusia_phi.AAC.1